MSLQWPLHVERRCVGSPCCTRCRLYNSLPGSEDNCVSYLKLVSEAKRQVHLYTGREAKPAPLPRRPSLNDAVNTLKTTRMTLSEIERKEAVRDLVMALAWRDPERAAVTSTEGWSFSADSAEELRANLMHLLRGNGMRISDVFKVMDTDGNSLISRDEWMNVLLANLGFRGPRALLEDVFDELDSDRSGTQPHGVSNRAGRTHIERGREHTHRSSK
jgi:hypothetical protein